MYVWNSSCIIQIDHYIAIVCEIRGTLYRFSPERCMSQISKALGGVNVLDRR